MMTAERPPIDSSDAMELIAEFTRRGADTYYFPTREGPHTEIAGVLRRGPHWCDVYVLRGEDRVAAYRAYLINRGDNPLVPDAITWHYLGSAGPVLRALLALPAPGLDTAEAYVPPHPDLGVPLGQRLRYTVRPPRS